MATSAQLDLSVWRNDDVYEFPLRVRGLDLTSVALAMQIRLRRDTPGAPLADLLKVTNGNAEGLRVAGVNLDGSVPVSDVRIRLNKSTRQALPYTGELGDSTPLEYAMLIGGRTRLTGRVVVLAHAFGSDGAPVDRPPGWGGNAGTGAPHGGATLTIAGDDVATLIIDGVDIAIAASDRAAAAKTAAELAASTATAAGRYFPTKAAGEAASTTNQLFSTDDGAGNVIYYKRTASGSTEIGRALTPGSLAATGAASGIGFDGRTVAAKLIETVSVRDPRFAGGAKGDGITDDSAAFQAAQDTYPNGAVIIVPPGLYLVDRVNITSRNITLRLDPAAAVKRAGTPSYVNRAMFRVENLPNANFTFEGGSVDLNGEGPLGIGVAGRYANLYASQTVRGTIAMAGPNSELVFGLRSTLLTVRNTSIKNSGETAILFRNCSDTAVEHVRFSNLGNAGVEYSWTLAANDGGTGPIPDGSRHHVRWCYFEDIDDFGLGSGNGCAVYGGGDPPYDVVRTIEVSDCEFVRCQRDVHFEISSSTKYVDGVKLRGGRSQEARQGSVGFVNARGSVEDWEAFNPGAAPTAALSSNYADIYGMVVSGPNTGRVTISNFRAIQNLATKVYRGTDGSIPAKSTAFTSASANFSGADVGRPIGIQGAGPQSSNPGTDPGYVTHIAQIVQVVSSTKVIIDRPAITGVSGATYAYGNALREGIRLLAAVDVSIVKGKIEGGVASGLPAEPPAAAINVVSCTGRITVDGVTMTAPATPGAVPAGLRLAGVMAGKLKYRNLDVSGYVANLSGIDLYRASCVGPTLASANGASVTPGATIGTDGAEYVVTPRSGYFVELSALALIPSLNAETLTLTIRGYRYDGTSPNEITIPLSTSGAERTISAYELWQINQDNAPLQAFGIKVRSSKAGSSAKVPFYLRAVEG